MVRVLVHWVNKMRVLGSSEVINSAGAWYLEELLVNRKCCECRVVMEREWTGIWKC
jgi:hypothetical protein